MKTTIKLLNGNILKEKKRYRWSGHTEGLYTGLSWANFLCKIKKIKDGIVTIYDYDDNSEYNYTIQDLKKMDATFKRFLI